ncbi:MAG: RNA-binding protein [Woronichinia naegeliana WA131]|jgi:RNA recognition motif-containing protein|uniref:RNA-binding protein n=1 Tax=Woronichinia naegeliana WA131 TaxID=2824559 RepID=A0A977KYG3_9CYAN|nr:MAG: RNA-binding protein [Woronichinia naegeliana WA131]
MSVRLYVGNLPKEPIERQALQEVFAEANAVVSTKVIKDRKTGKCRGFAFVTVSTDEAADEFIEKYNGQSFMDSPLKIEKALPRAKGKENGEGEGDGDDEAIVSETEVNTTAVASKPTSVKKASKKRNRNQSNSLSSSSSSSEGVQPDPRWADKLAQLKEMLAAANN